MQTNGNKNDALLSFLFEMKFIFCELRFKFYKQVRVF